VALAFTLEDNAIISIPSSSDTILKIFNLQGQLILQHNTSQMEHYQGLISARFIMLATWTPDVKVLQVVKEKKLSMVKSVSRVMNLGHYVKVLSVTCDLNEEKVVTICSNGSVKL